MTRIGAGAVLVVLGCVVFPARGQIFIAGSGKVGEYNLDGTTVNASLITGLNGPTGIVASGGNLYVFSSGTGVIGKYTTAGAAVNASLITDSGVPSALAVSGGDIFVANRNSGGATGTLAEYTTGGTLVSAALVSGLNEPVALAMSDDGLDLFVLNSNGVVGKYSTSGATVNAALISGLTSLSVNGMTQSGGNLYITSVAGNIAGRYDASTGAGMGAVSVSFDPRAITAFGSSLYVARSNAFVGQYTTSGSVVNASLIAANPAGIAVIPEPGGLAVASMIGLVGVLTGRRGRRAVRSERVCGDRSALVGSGGDL